MLQARRLVFSYPGRPPLFRDLDLAIEPGERVAIIGPNGSGKSTLLRCLSGVTPCGAGQLLIHGHDPALDGERAEALARIGFLFDSPEEQFVAPTVEREIAFGLENRGVEARRLRTDVAVAVEQFGLSGLASRNPGTLSGGEGQRLALASVLVTSPSYLFLDEPTSRLDTRGREALEDWLSALRPRPALIEATLRRDEAVRADRLLGVHEGQVIEIPRSGNHLCLDALISPPAGGGPGPSADRTTRPVRLEARGLGFHPPGAPRPVLRDLDIEARAGALLVVLGPTASGKTTLLRILAGFEKPHTGRVVIGTEANGRAGAGTEGGAPALPPRVGYLPQFPERLLFAPTVLEDVAYGPRRLGLGRAEAVERARAALAAVGIEGAQFEPAFPGDLSHGERRRVAIAGLLATRPDIILLDEPEIGLDRNGRDRIRAIAAGLLDSGVAIVVTTHEADWLGGLPARTVILERASASGSVVAA